MFVQLTNSLLGVFKECFKVYIGLQNWTEANTSSDL